MTEPYNFDDEMDFPDYESMDQYYYRPEVRAGYYGIVEKHPLAPRFTAEGWVYTSEDFLWKGQGDIDYGIWPGYQLPELAGSDKSEYPLGNTRLGWVGVLNAEGFFYQHFDTLGDALDAFRDRNFRGFQRLLPDPDNDIDSEYEGVLYGFSVARGNTPVGDEPNRDLPPYNY